ncbi:MAG: glutathione S-transferase N-terminal domain-containing protein [Gammaproteobacteria bacterium]|nr:glutathione S-transferase N-terminal domain-containing protein [Gammaproteobacteria bacterium]
MAVVANKRSVMTLYTSPSDINGHQVRIVLAEKGVAVDYVLVKRDDALETLAELNPYGTLPTLVDRDLVLFNTQVIMEYLDERFPHPPLLPIYPVARARARLMMCRIEKEWYRYANIILSDASSPEEVEQAREELTQSLLAVAKAFGESSYFLNDDFSLIDCMVVPLLWRLEKMKISLSSPKAKPIHAYMKKMFERESFLASLTEKEHELRA